MLNREVGFASRTDIVSQVCQVRKVPTTDMSIDDATPGAKDRRGVTQPSGLLPVVSTCRRPHLSAGNFSLRVAAVSLRQTESPPRFGGLPMSVQMANQVHAAINYENSGGRHVFWVIS